MQVTEVQITLADGASGKLRAFATITVDGCFVVHDLKLVSSKKGLFVSMPSRMMTTRCSRCRCKVRLRARYCDTCGKKVPLQRTELDERGQAKLFADIAHPVNQACRKHIEEEVIAIHKVRRPAILSGSRRP